MGTPGEEEECRSVCDVNIGSCSADAGRKYFDFCFNLAPNYHDALYKRLNFLGVSLEFLLIIPKITLLVDKVNPNLSPRSRGGFFTFANAPTFAG